MVPTSWVVYYTPKPRDVNEKDTVFYPLAPFDPDAVKLDKIFVSIE
jgi:hypothetical protein